MKKRCKRDRRSWWDRRRTYIGMETFEVERRTYPEGPWGFGMCRRVVMPTFVVSCQHGVGDSGRRGHKLWGSGCTFEATGWGVNVTRADE